MKKVLCISTLLFCILFSNKSIGQIRSQLGDYYHSLPRLSGWVTDSTFRNVIPLAHVFLLNGKDTIRLVSDLSGRFSYPERLSDTIQIQATAVGFKPFTGLYIPKIHGMAIRIGLQQENTMLNEIIVTGKRLAMVIKGDTLVYNADVVKSLEGDMLKDILMKMPGINIDNGLMVNGVNISRIYINGVDTLFKGTQALNYISADNVKNVKVFDEFNKKDQEEGLKYGLREKVMDVTTKRKVSKHVKTNQNSTRKKYTNYKFYLGGGADASRNQTTKFSEKFLIGFNIAKDKTLPYTREDLYFDGQYSNLFQNDQKEFLGSFNYQKITKNNWTYITDNKYRNTTLYNNRWNEQDYFPTEQYDSRRYEQTTTEKRSIYEYYTHQELRHIMRSKGAFNISVKYTYHADKTWKSDQMLSTMDEQVINSANVHDYSREYSSKGTIASNIQRYIKKGALLADFRLELSKGGHTSLQMDTLATSSRHIHLNRDWDNKVVSSQANILLRKTISPFWRLEVSSGYNYQEDGSKGIGENKLTNLLDTNNTRNYSHYNFSYYGNIEFASYQKKRMITLSGRAIRLHRNRVERFPVWEQTKDRFLNFNGSFYMKLDPNPTLHIQVRYYFATNQPMADQLRQVIDDTNPLNLRAGNPHLKQKKEHRFSINYNKIFAKQAFALKTDLVLQVIQHPIASNSIYFTKTEYLSQYDYTVQQGATLHTFQNTDPMYTLKTKIKFEKFFAFLGKCSLSLGYTKGNEPSFTQGQKNNLKRDIGNCDFKIQSNFSKKVSLSINSSTELFHSASQLSTSSNRLKETMNLGARTNIRKFSMYASFAYNYSKDFGNKNEVNETIVDASITRKFGKNFSMELVGKNLLDSQKSILLNQTAEYFSKSVNSQIGRYIYMKLSYNF